MKTLSVHEPLAWGQITMKMAIVVNQTVVWLAFATISSVCLPVFAGVTTYSAPPGEAVTGDYAVEVNGETGRRLRRAERVFRGRLLLRVIRLFREGGNPSDVGCGVG